jgi:hypothetical protein
MPFVEIPGMSGLVYAPERGKEKKKHACADCYGCRFCSDERCRMCLKKAGCAGCISHPALDRIPDKD